jgi:hypothetical protein
MTDYGLDVSTFPDLDPNASWIAGGRIVAEAVGRRLLTASGSLFYDTSAGYDLASLVGEGLTAKQTFRIQSIVKDEAEKDERVAEAGVEVTYAAEKLTIRVTLSLAEGPFVLNLTIDQVGSATLNIE